MANKEETKETIKQHLPDLLRDMGLNPRKKFKCLNPDHDDSNPSMSYNRKKLNVHCFSCGATYDIFDIVGLNNNLKDPKEIFKLTFDLYSGKPIDRTLEFQEKDRIDYSEYLNQCHSQISFTDYPQLRGLTEKSINKFNIGYDDKYLVTIDNQSTEWKVITIPTSKYSYLVRNTDLNASKSERIRKCGESNIFNLKALDESTKPIFVVEGEIDAISIHECGHYAIGLGSISNIYKFVNYLKQNRPKQKFILCLDNDTEGQNAQENLGKALEMNDIEYSKSNIAAHYKDVNEALVNDKEGLTSRIEEAIKDNPIDEISNDYKKNSAANYLNDFIQGIKASVNTKPIPTEFKQLDELLDGGLFEGLYIIGAIASLGKTTFLLQIADQIAKNNQDVLIVSLEMSKYELIAKSISRLTFKKTQEKGIDTAYAKTIRGITNGDRYKSYNAKDKEVIIESIKDYQVFASNIYIFEGVGEMGINSINEIIDNHIKITGNKPVVIIDYLQILSPYNDRLSDKQNIDKSTLELKRISRKYKIPVIAVSSFNRSSYTNTVSMESFKESGAIEYSSDVLIGLQYEKMNEDTNADNLNDYKKQDTRDIMLRVLKNRSGQIGDVCFGYKTKFSYFYEKSK